MNRKIFLAFALAASGLCACNNSATVKGTAEKSLTLNEPASISIERGGMTKADISITRHDLTGEVAIRFTDLPKGVDVVDSASMLVGDSATYTLRASASADLVEDSVAHVTATGPGDIAVSQPVNITVKAAK